MKTKTTLLILGLSTALLIGCDGNNDILDPAPAAPQGVISITGDRAVYLYWNGPYEADLKEYVVLRSFEEFDNYAEINRVAAESNPDLDLIIYEYIDSDVANGQTYFYAVQTIDRSGQRSGLSAETVFDTPRPEGEVTLFPRNYEDSLAGFNFESQSVVRGTSVAADIYLYFDEQAATHFLTVGNSLIDIQDVGYTYNFDDISFAPDSGWSAFLDVELILGHTYIIWTDADNFAKVRPIWISPSTGAVRFQWAFQTDPGNRELKPRATRSRADR